MEIKNINSFNDITTCLDFEVKRQKKALELGDVLVAETRGVREG